MGDADSLAALLTDRALRRLAGERSYERGLDYAEHGAVREVREAGGTLSARVQGTSAYRVTIRAGARGRMTWTCTCPIGQREDFCKHAVAAALAWREGRETGTPLPPRPSPARDSATIDRFIGTQDRESLARIVKERAEEDPALRQKLKLAAAQRNKGGPDLETMREGIREAAATGGFVDYRGMRAFAEGLEQAADSVEALIGTGHPEAAVDLAEFLLKRLERTIEHVDDSDGEVGDVMRRVQDIHHRACVAARPDPVALARRLFEREVSSEWEVFMGAAATYADVLGPAGLAEYRRRAEKEWARVPELAPGTPESASDRYGRRFKITEMMRALAGATGGLDAEIAVMARDLSGSYQFFLIAEKLRAARRYEEAKAWGLRGVQTFGAKTDARLVELLADEHHRASDHAQAMELAWGQFAQAPFFESYKALKSHADRAGEWPAWRERALALIRSGNAAGAGRGRGAGQADAGTLVRIFLWEKDPATALREAQATGCPGELALELARALESSDPEHALAIYRSLLPGTVSRSVYADYHGAVELAKRVRALLGKLGRQGEFPEYVRSLRTEFKAKRNFMKLLAEEGW